MFWWYGLSLQISISDLFSTFLGDYLSTLIIHAVHDINIILWWQVACSSETQLQLTIKRARHVRQGCMFALNKCHLEMCQTGVI